MSEQQAPKGMITVEDFAKRNGLTPVKVIKMIKDGFYIGRVIGGQWYVESTDPHRTRTTSKNIKGAYQSEYVTARMVSKFISFLGWVVFTIGIIVVFASMASNQQSIFGDASTYLVLLPGLATVVSGLFLVAAGQVTRATVDNADHTREILNEIRGKS